MNQRDLQSALRIFPRVVFDLDDTLYDKRDFDEGALRCALAVIATASGVRITRVAAVFDAVRRRDPASRVLLDDVARELGLAPRVARAAVRAFRAHDASLLSPVRSLRTLLQSLRGAGHRLALVTNGFPAIQRRKIARLEIGPLFDRIVICDAAKPGRSKPAPWAWTRLAGWRADHPVAMVGDADTDGQFAQAGGAHFIRFRYRRSAR